MIIAFYVKILRLHKKKPQNIQCVKDNSCNLRTEEQDNTWTRIPPTGSFKIIFMTSCDRTQTDFPATLAVTQPNDDTHNDTIMIFKLQYFCHIVTRPVLGYTPKYFSSLFKFVFVTFICNTQTCTDFFLPSGKVKKKHCD